MWSWNEIIFSFRSTSKLFEVSPLGRRYKDALRQSVAAADHPSLVAPLEYHVPPRPMTANKVSLQLIISRLPHEREKENDIFKLKVLKSFATCKNNEKIF